MSSVASSASYATAFSRLFRAASILEDLNDEASFATPVDPSDSASQVTITGGVSQVTVDDEDLPPGVFRSDSSTVVSKASSDKTQDPPKAGLPEDKEGKDTRKQFLARRRKEAEVDEVKVALAPIMKIPVPFSFYPDQYKRFRALFPRVNVDSGMHFNHHDHPVAHAATMVGIRYVQSMLKPGTINLDLHGNPGGNEGFNRFQSSRLRKKKELVKVPIIETMVEENVAADAVRRVTKWGPEKDEFGVRRYFKGSLDTITPGLYDDFISIHTLYYYSMYQVTKLLKNNPGRRLIALVNYEKSQTGTLYNELNYSKQGGMTVQVSPNGEKYSHPDIDPWFQTNSFRPHFDTLGAGIAWTSHNVGGPLYAITITSCEYNLARTYRYEPPTAPTLQVQPDSSLLGLVSLGGKRIRLRISNADLASELRHYMVFRDRADPEVFKSLCVKARRVTGKDLNDGQRQFEVKDGELQDHITYAYLVDAPGELELVDGIRLLQGGLLTQLSEALTLKGDPEGLSFFAAMIATIFGHSEIKPVFSGKVSRTKTQKDPIARTRGGLLPLARS